MVAPTLAVRNKGTRPAPVLHDGLVPASIDSTGETDVTAQLQAHVDAQPNGTAERPTVVKLQPGGQYRIENRVVFADRYHFVVDLNGGMLFADLDGDGTTGAGGRHRRQLSFSRCRDITVRNGSIRGSNLTGGMNGTYHHTLEAQHCIGVGAHLGGLHIHDVDLGYMWGDGVYTEAPVPGTPVADALTLNGVIERCSIHHTGRQGVANVCGDWLTIRDCSFYEMRRSAIDYEPHPRYAVRHNYVVDNTFATTLFNVIAAWGSTEGDVSHMRAMRNTAIGRHFNVFGGSNPHFPRHDWRIENNTGGGTPGGTTSGTIVNLESTIGVTVRGNFQRYANNYSLVAVRLVQCSNVVVENNDLKKLDGTDVPSSITALSATPALDDATHMWTPSDYLSTGVSIFADQRGSADLQFGSVSGHGNDTNDPERLIDTAPRYYIGFDGVNDYLVRDDAALNWAVTGEHTLSAVVQFAALSGTQVVASKKDGAGNGYELKVVGATLTGTVTVDGTDYTSTVSGSMEAGVAYVVGLRCSSTQVTTYRHVASPEPGGTATQGTTVTKPSTGALASSAPFYVGRQASTASPDYAGMRLYGLAVLHILVGTGITAGLGVEFLHLAEVKD